MNIQSKIPAVPGITLKKRISNATPKSSKDEFLDSFLTELSKYLEL